MEFHKVHTQLLQRHHLFAPLKEDDLKHLVSRARVMSLSKGDFLFMQGDHVEHFYFVISGCIKLFRNLPDGTEKIIELVHDEQTFAEALMFKAKNNYPVSTQAVESTELFSFPCAEYLSLVKANTDLCLALLGNLSARLRRRLAEIEVLSLKNSTQRVARYLLSQLDADDSEQTDFELPVAKRHIAAQLAIQPETLSRIVYKLKEEGIIEMQGKRVKVIHRKGLENYERGPKPHLSANSAFHP